MRFDDDVRRRRRRFHLFYLILLLLLQIRVIHTYIFFVCIRKHFLSRLEHRPRRLGHSNT